MDKKDMVNVIHIHLKWVKEPSDPSQQWKQSKSCKAHGVCPPVSPIRIRRGEQTRSATTKMAIRLKIWIKVFLQFNIIY